MRYRRFGKTELEMPVLTCGGMRFQQTWNEGVPEDIAKEGQEQLEAIIHRAVDSGINHIETARGYGSSEYQLGFVLPQLPRDELIVQTKIGPQDSEDAFLAAFDESLKRLQLDYVDLLGVHGINTAAVLENTLKNGTLSACRKLQDRGVVRHVGFSTHGPDEVVRAAVETDEFSYVNLHWFYFDQSKTRSIDAATARDMGVFIISPSDKGGLLFKPPARLVELCSPLTPMGFNDLFCLANQKVHTISIGAARPSDFDAHLEILDILPNAETVMAPVIEKLESRLREAMGDDWAANWQEGLPHTINVPEELGLYHVLRIYNMAKAFDMIEFGKMRYNLLGSGGHWFPGVKLDKVDMKLVQPALEGYQFADRIPDILNEAHELFNAEDKKRLSESSA